jgi:peptidoglycan/xylan/chitin deacetylase (PgdA/CDA1 family)
MYKHFIKTPWIVKKIFSSYVWKIPSEEKTVYLTFDDGPHPQITSFVLDELKKYNALATFFCIGKNVLLYPETYQRVLSEGHAVGNHTYDHVDGWKVSTQLYLNNIAEASKQIHSHLFRPPYGKIKNKQAKRITEVMTAGTKIIMWDVLSADFDTALSGAECLKNVLVNYDKGSIIVFHDSEKAFPRLQYCLPETLKRLSEEGYNFKKIE